MYEFTGNQWEQTTDMGDLGNLRSATTSRRRGLGIAAAVGAVVLVLPATLAMAAEPEPFAIGFENESDVSDALAPGSFARVDRAESGTGGIEAASGCYYGLAPVTTHADAFVATQYAGYTDEFPDGGYETSIDVYLDVDLDVDLGGNDRVQFDWSHALNNQGGTHLRDYIFYVSTDGTGVWTVSTGHGTAQSAPWLSNHGADPFEITESGWYTLHHEFGAESDFWGDARDDHVLAVLSVRDGDGEILTDGTGEALWYLTARDHETISDTVGGNRYGWLVNNGFDGLPIDDVTIRGGTAQDNCPGNGDNGDDNGNGNGGDDNGDTPPEGETVTETLAVASDPDAAQTIVSATVTGQLRPECNGSIVSDSEYFADTSEIATPPPGVSQPFGALGVELCVVVGSTATISLELSSPANALYKVTSAAANEWSEYPATISGTTVTFEVTDGGAGDLDGVADGVIVDPVAPSIVAGFTG